MKVSHEIPFAYLENSLKFNDYDYLLPHLYDEYTEYREFFKRENHATRRYIVMDNSLHELGVPYSKGRMISIIDEVKPDEFIVPDVWENCNASVRNAKTWASVELPEGVEKVAVVQGKSYIEFATGYQRYKWLGYQKIAFSYGASWFQETFQHPNPYVAKMMGRLKTINNLYKNNIIGDFDRVHLLGCNLPQEFLYYKDFKFIESIDTSNPVIHGLKGMRYSEGGLLHKDKEKIDENFVQPISEKQKEDVLHNVKMFRKMNRL